MSALEESHKLAHPFYRIMELPEKELRKKIVTMSREEIIEWLRWNDPNGVYSDSDSLHEFGEIMSKKEGETIMLRQILEG
jgi:hypothetical protein